MSKIEEMPHLELNRDVGGVRYGTIDLRIERYPLPRAEKQNLLASFHKEGVVAPTKNGWIFFGQDEVRKATDSEVKQLQKLPNDWQEYTLSVHEAKSYVTLPKMSEVFGRRKR
jgi:hypothetical protein